MVSAGKGKGRKDAPMDNNNLGTGRIRTYLIPHGRPLLGTIILVIDTIIAKGGVITMISGIVDQPRIPRFSIMGFSHYVGTLVTAGIRTFIIVHDGTTILETIDIKFPVGGLIIGI